LLRIGPYPAVVKGFLLRCCEQARPSRISGYPSALTFSCVWQQAFLNSQDNDFFNGLLCSLVECLVENSRILQYAKLSNDQRSMPKKQKINLHEND
jgi:hypothetical protein